MQRVQFILLVLVLVLGLSGVVCATSAEQDFTGPVQDIPAPETVPVVALDPDTIQSIADVVNATEPIGDDVPNDSEPTIPLVALDPDAIDSISSAVGESVSDAIAAATVPDVAVNFASNVSGGYYFIADCALGRSVKFWVPVDYKSGSIAFSGSNLVNMTNSNIYIMPDSSSLSDYTIYAPRFSTFQYRRDSTYYRDLDITKIIETNISFLQDTPQALPDTTYWVVIIAVVVIGFLLLLFIKKG